jgi:hypothetical protein
MKALALALSLFVVVGLCAQTGTQTTPDQLSPGTNVPVTPQTLYYVCVPIPGTGTPGKYACQVAVFPQATTSIVNGQLTITIPLTTGPQGLQGLQGVTGPAGTNGINFMLGKMTTLATTTATTTGQTLTLSAAPVGATDVNIWCFKNGQRLTITNGDFSVAGTTVTFVQAMQIGANLVCSY